MLAVSAMSTDMQAVLYFVALVAFVVAAVISFIGKAHTFALLCTGLALIDLVWLWNSLASS